MSAYFFINFSPLAYIAFYTYTNKRHYYYIIISVQAFIFVFLASFFIYPYFCLSCAPHGVRDSIATFLY